MSLTYRAGKTSAMAYDHLGREVPFVKDPADKHRLLVDEGTLLEGTAYWKASMWEDFDRRNAYSRAAQTRVDELVKMGVPIDEIHLRRIDNNADLESAWADWAKIDIVEGLDFYSHGSGAGPEVRLGTTMNWDNAAILNWGSVTRTKGQNTFTGTPYATFNGCNTANGSFAQNFANRQGVTTYGNTDFSSFSYNANRFSGISSVGTQTPVYLGVYKEIYIISL